MSDETLSAEIRAMEEFGTLRSRLIRRVTWLSVIVGVAVGAVVFAVTVDRLMRSQGRVSVQGAALLGFGPPMVIAIAAGRFVARYLARRRCATWIRQVAAKHGVPAEKLDESARIANLL